jgi:transcriptional regulator of arginine metabolism
MEAGKRAIDQAVLRLISQHAVPDQATLLTLLADEGIKLTQGTLSRRLARLSIRKRSGRYQRVVNTSQPIPPYSVAQSSPNLLVLQTHHGLGQALAMRVDRNSVRGVVGTVAGEDALFIAIHGEVTLQEVQAQVELMLGPPQVRL